MYSIDGLFTENDYDEISISTNALEYNQYGSQIHQDINAGDYRFNISEIIKQTQSQFKGE